MQNRLIAIQVDKQRRMKRAEGESPNALLAKCLVLLTVKNRVERFGGLFEFADRTLAVHGVRMRFQEGLVVFEHATDGFAILLPERIAMETDEGRSLQPFFDEIEQRVIGGGNHGLLGISTQVTLVRLFIEAQALFGSEPELVFDQTKLDALKTARGMQVVAKVQEVEWSHGFQDPNLGDQ